MDPQKFKTRMGDLAMGTALHAAAKDYQKVYIDLDIKPFGLCFLLVFRALLSRVLKSVHFELLEMMKARNPG
jgi:hypothetical protein